MAQLIFGLLGILGLIAFLSQGADTFNMKTAAESLAPYPPDEKWSRIKSVIVSRDLKGMDPDCLFLMADMENGFSIGDFTATFRATNSLFNRHKGRGVLGEPNSDGVWTGRTFYASPADADLRVYDSLEDSVDDFLQLMQESLYADAFNAALNGDVPGYIAAVAKVGYAATPNYQTSLTSRARALGIA